MSSTTGPQRSSSPATQPGARPFTRNIAQLTPLTSLELAELCRIIAAESSLKYGGLDDSTTLEMLKEELAGLERLEKALAARCTSLHRDVDMIVTRLTAVLDAARDLAGRA